MTAPGPVEERAPGGGVVEAGVGLDEGDALDPAAERGHAVEARDDPGG